MIRNKIFPWAVTALLFFSACEKDELTDRPDSGTDQHLPHTGEQFIVDYTVGNGVTRSGETNESDNRIKSILYLLYQDGTLVKKREIPLKSGETHFQFPMTRDNMSWEQREALKDTLDINTTYTAVFVANAEEGKTLLLDKMEGGETIPRPFSEICLQLPETAITKEDEMFYLFTQEILSSNGGADRDNPYNCPVMLQRVVSKTEFRRPVLTVTEVEQMAERHLKGLLQTWMEKEGLIAKAVKKVLDAFADDLIKVYEVSLDPNIGLELEKLKKKINEFAYWENDLKGKLEQVLYEQLRNDLLHNPKLALPSFYSWSGYVAEVHYNQVANQLKIQDWLSLTQGVKTIQATIGEEDGENKFFVITFGQNQVNDELNKIQEIVLQKENVELIVPVKDKQPGILGNQTSTMQYAPFTQMQYVEGDKTISSFVFEHLNLEELLDYHDSKIIPQINEVLFNKPDSKYKNSFTDFTLSFDIPDLSVENSIEVAGEWSVVNRNEP